MSPLYDPAASWDIGQYLWGMGEIPEHLFLYDFLTAPPNVFSVLRGWQRIEDQYDRSFPS